MRWRARFDFLILDWMLPGKSGIELCREVAGASGGDEMFILLVTARDDTEDLERALAAGANDYLTKPLDPACSMCAFGGRAADSRSGRAQPGARGITGNGPEDDRRSWRRRLMHFLRSIVNGSLLI